MKQLSKFIHHVYLWVVRNTAGQFAQLSDLKDQVLGNLVKLRPYELEGLEVPLVPVLLQIQNIFPQLFELLETLAYFHQDTFLPVLAILEVTKSLLFEVAIDKKTLNFAELSEQTLELLVIVFFYSSAFFPHRG